MASCMIDHITRCFPDADRVPEPPEPLRRRAPLQPAVSYVWARPGRLSALSIFYSKSVLYGVFVRHVGRLTAQNGGFRPGQSPRRAGPVLTGKSNLH